MIIDSKVANFAVMGTAPSGTRQVVFSNVHWKDTGPFEAPYRPYWEVTATNLFSEPVDFSIGMWWYWDWQEGGWNGPFHLNGFETKTFQGASVIPAEAGVFGLQGNMTFYTPGWPQFAYPSDLGLVAECKQRDSDLIPAGQPQVYPNWSGLREFPVPASPYGTVCCIKEIALPMLSRSLPTVGKLKVQLLSPKDYALWKSYVCYWSLTESRCGLGIPNGPAISYRYDIGAGLYFAQQGLKAGWGTSVTLTDTDSSGLFAFDMNFKPTTFSVGSYPFALQMTVGFPNPPVSSLHPMFFGKSSQVMLMYPTVGYVSVVN